jgi:hypothetical protein
MGNEQDDVIFTSAEVEDALKNFQRVAGLNVNGTLVNHFHLSLILAVCLVDNGTVFCIPIV